MCEYCESGKPLIGDEQDGACIENGNILVAYGECHTCAEGRINYCPVCGRKLTEENTHKVEIKIDPLDFHVGLKDKMAEFESLIRKINPGKKLAENIEKKLKSRFCHCCFFGHVEGELCGEPLCNECAKILYGFGANEEHPSIKKINPYYQLWYRRQKALPIFEAYLHAELELADKFKEAK